MATKKKIDYDGEEFYNQIFTLASGGATDEQLAFQLNPSLRASTFKAMKEGTYERWTPTQNARRSERIQRTLEQARSKVDQAITNVMLRSMLGKNKSVTTVEKTVTEYDAAGQVQGSTVIKTVTTTEEGPNIRLIEKWLTHHDQNWRKIEQEMKGIIIEGKSVGSNGNGLGEGDDEFNINILYRDIKDLNLQLRDEDKFFTPPKSSPDNVS